MEAGKEAAGEAAEVRSGTLHVGSKSHGCTIALGWLARCFCGLLTQPCHAYTCRGGSMPCRAMPCLVRHVMPRVNHANAAHTLSVLSCNVSNPLISRQTVKAKGGEAWEVGKEAAGEAGAAAKRAGGGAAESAQRAAGEVRGLNSDHGAMRLGRHCSAWERLHVAKHGMQVNASQRATCAHHEGPSMLPPHTLQVRERAGEAGEKGEGSWARWFVLVSKAIVACMLACSPPSMAWPGMNPACMAWLGMAWLATPFHLPAMHVSLPLDRIHHAFCRSSLPAAKEATAEVRQRAAEAGEAAKQRAAELTEQGGCHPAAGRMGGW